MALTYVEMPVRLHAVATEDDGTTASRTACGRPSRFPPEEVEHVPWRAAHIRQRCLECAKATGFMAISDTTGETVPGILN